MTKYDHVMFFSNGEDIIPIINNKPHFKTLSTVLVKGFNPKKHTYNGAVKIFGFNKISKVLAEAGI